MVRYLLLFLLIVALIPMLISCGSEPNGEKTDRTVFRYNEAAGISSLDPAFARNLENIWAVHQIFNGLVTMNEDMEVVPCIAKDWKISDDGTIYTFYLRDDVRFHDDPVFPGGEGRKVVAQDFVHSFFRILDKETASPGEYIFSKVDQGERGDNMGFTAPNDTTLKIFLKEPFPPFLGLLTMKYCSVIPHEAVAHYGKEFREHPVGTGPFKFKQWKEGVKLVLTRNEHYFEKDEKGRRLPYLDAVSITFKADEQTAFLEFTKGNYDFLSGLDGSYKDKVLTTDGQLADRYQGDFRMEKQPFLKTDYLGMLMKEKDGVNEKSPLLDKRIRRAVNFAIDREKMVKHLRNGIGQPANNGFVPFGLPAYKEYRIKGYSYDPERAKRLLKEAGYPNGKGLPTITLSTTSSYTDLCEFIQHHLEEVGIDIEVEVLPAANHREYVAQSRVPFFRKSWIADYPDAENFLALFLSENFSPAGPNYTHFENARYDSLYDQAMETVNDSARYRLYKKMERILIEEAPVVPLFYDEAVRFVQPHIKGLKDNSMYLDLKRVRKSEPKTARSSEGKTNKQHGKTLSIQ